MRTEMDFPSKAPKRTYATTLDEQLDELRTDELMLRFAESRRQLASDPHRPIYHFVNPEGYMSDPNGLCFWQGRYHLFYQAWPPEDHRQHWGHAISDDLVHWSDLPLAIYPGIEEACYSGNALVEEDRVIACYQGRGAGIMVAIADDPLLLNWEKIPGNPVIPQIEADSTGRPYRVFDPCIWKEDDGYYALSGAFWDGVEFEDARMVQHIFHSQDLRRWIYLGPFVEGDDFTARGESGVVPYFWPFGDRHILVFASHPRGSQYLLGDYDKVNHRFRPNAHGRFNFGPMIPGAIHAPSVTPDGSGGLYAIFNLNDGGPGEGWGHVMSLGRRLTLLEDKTMGIEPVPGVESLRGDHRQVGETALPANSELVIAGIEGNAMELVAEIDPKDAREVCVNVLRSPDSEEYTAIRFYRQGYHFRRRWWLGEERRVQQDALVIDTSRSSVLPNVHARIPEVAPFDLKDGEPLRLRVFIDKGVVEVFANGRQCLTLRVYPGREDSVGVSIRAQGNDAVLRSMDAWQMKSIWKV